MVTRHHLVSRAVSLLLIVPLLLIITIGLFGSSGQAAASSQTPSTSADKSGIQNVSSGTIAQDNAHVWTSEEMRNAIPYPLDISGAAKALQNPTEQPGPTTSVNPGMPSHPADKAGTDLPAILAGDNGGDPASVTVGSGSMSPDNYNYPFPYYRTQIYNVPYTNYPYSTVGKVFFTDPSNGYSYVCSASSSGNHSVVTAGHCVYNNVTHRWMTNWVFVPAYKDGAAPLGQWIARELWTRTEWQGGNYGYDVGMAVLYNNGYGYSISQWVGWLGSMFNATRNQYFTALGYPAAPPFSGQRMNGCWAPHATDDGSYSNPPSMGIGCDQTGGTSGGPWVLYFGGGNYVNGVNSYRYNSQPQALYGPYFGSGIYSLYTTVLGR